MYCQCPHCHTLFGISAAQLRAGRGRVRCGQCMEVFDSLDHLSDDLFGADGPPIVGDRVTEAQEASPSVDIAAGDELAPMLARIRPEPGDRLLTPERSAAELEGEPSRSRERALTEHEHAREPVLGFENGSLEAQPAPPPLEAVAEAGEDDGSAEPTPAAAGDATPVSQEADDIPEVLREDIARLAGARRARRAAVLFALGSVLLLAGLLAQAAWFRPGTVLRSYPEARPLLERFCRQTGCRLPERRDPALIRMLSRVVRVHPRYEGALQVIASIVNTAPYDQPYPRLQFTLYNVNGQVIATRVFKPSEYLAKGMDPHGYMSPGKPVQISLALLAPEDAAVSFEFRFL